MLEIASGYCLVLLQDLALVQSLLAEGQDHLFQQWPAAGEKDDEKRQMMEQARTWEP